jgi:hypothetical protein
MNIKLQIPAAEITIAYEELSFKKVEEEILALLKQIGRRMLEEFLRFVDEEEYRRRCGASGLESRGKKGSGKYIETVFGVIRYIRRRYHERGKPGGRYLADEKLGIGTREIASPGKQKAEIESAVDARSYRKAAAEEERWAGVKRSHESIRQLVLKEGQRIKEQREAQIKEAELSACYGDARVGSDEPRRIPRDVAYVEADSTYLPLQRRKHRSKNNGKRNSREKKKLEIKLGIIYSGHAKRYAGGNGGQKRLQEKQVYAAVDTSGQFMKKFSVLCELTHMVSAARRVIVGGDGARWIKEGMKDYFINGVYVLCRYHLNRALKRALGYNKVLEKQIRGLIKNDRIPACIEMLTTVLQGAIDLPNKQIKKLKELRVYLNENADGINAIERLKKEIGTEERQLIRHTGGIEGNIDKVIAQRMKGKGMSWSVRGAESLLQIISRQTNGEWEQWWVGERDRKITVNEADYRALEMVSFWKESKPHDPSMMSVAPMPALHGPHQDRAWVSALRDVSGGGYSVR